MPTSSAWRSGLASAQTVSAAASSPTRRGPFRARAVGSMLRLRSRASWMRACSSASFGSLDAALARTPKSGRTRSSRAVMSSAKRRICAAHTTVHSWAIRPPAGRCGSTCSTSCGWSMATSWSTGACRTGSGSCSRSAPSGLPSPSRPRPRGQGGCGSAREQQPAKRASRAPVPIGLPASHRKPAP